MTESLSGQDSTSGIDLEHIWEVIRHKLHKMLAPFSEMWNVKLGEVSGIEHRMILVECA